MRREGEEKSEATALVWFWGIRLSSIFDEINDNVAALFRPVLSLVRSSLRHYYISTTILIKSLRF